MRVVSVMWKMVYLLEQPPYTLDCRLGELQNRSIGKQKKYVSHLAGVNYNVRRFVATSTEEAAELRKTKFVRHV
jgi:hypothetical protein